MNAKAKENPLQTQTDGWMDERRGVEAMMLTFACYPGKKYREVLFSRTCFTSLP